MLKLPKSLETWGVHKRGNISRPAPTPRHPHTCSTKDERKKTQIRTKSTFRTAVNKSPPTGEFGFPKSHQLIIERDRGDKNNGAGEKKTAARVNPLTGSHARDTLITKTQPLALSYQSNLEALPANLHVGSTPIIYDKKERPPRRKYSTSA